MSLLYCSVTSDIISGYSFSQSFSQSYRFLNNLENSKNFFATFKKSSKSDVFPPRGAVDITGS
jgi:hypothetical protein